MGGGWCYPAITGVGGSGPVHGAFSGLVGPGTDAAVAVGLALVGRSRYSSTMACCWRKFVTGAAGGSTLQGLMLGLLGRGCDSGRLGDLGFF